MRGATSVKREHQSDGENSDGDNNVKLHVKSDRKKATCFAGKNRLNTPCKELCSTGGIKQCLSSLRYEFRTVYNEPFIDIQLEPEFPITG